MKEIIWNFSVVAEREHNEEEKTYFNFPFVYFLSIIYFTQRPNFFKNVVTYLKSKNARESWVYDLLIEQSCKSPSEQMGWNMII